MTGKCTGPLLLMTLVTGDFVDFPLQNNGVIVSMWTLLFWVVSCSPSAQQRGHERSPLRGHVCLQSLLKFLRVNHHGNDTRNKSPVIVCSLSFLFFSIANVILFYICTAEFNIEYKELVFNASLWWIFSLIKPNYETATSNDSQKSSKWTCALQLNKAFWVAVCFRWNTSWVVGVRCQFVVCAESVSL